MPKEKIPEKKLQRKQLRVLAIGAGPGSFAQTVAEMEARAKENIFERCFVFSLKDSGLKQVAKTATAGVHYQTVRQVKTEGTLQDTVRHFLQMGAKHSTAAVDGRLTAQTAALLKNGRAVHVLEHCASLPDSLEGYTHLRIHSGRQETEKERYAYIHARFGEKLALAICAAEKLSSPGKGTYIDLGHCTVMNADSGAQAIAEIKEQLGIKADGKESNSETQAAGKTDIPPAPDRAGDGQAGGRQDLHDETGDKGLCGEIRPAGTDNRP